MIGAYIFIGGILIFMAYDISKSKSNKKRNVMDVKFEDDKWYYFKLKLLFFIVFLVLGLLLLILQAN